MVPAKILAEIPERAATGEVQTIFAELRRHVGLVALIYRHLATFPGVLEWTWRVLGPAFDDGQMRARAARLRNAVDLDPARQWRPFETNMREQFAAADLAAIGDVLDGYNRANPTNILGVLVLGRALGLAVLTSSPAPDFADDLMGAPPPRLPSLPPLVALADLGAGLSRAIAGLSSRGVTDGDAIVPSLYRHLANWPSYVAAAANVLGPLFVSGKIATMANQVRHDARAEAEAVFAALEPAGPLPFSDETRDAVLKSLEIFVRRIPEMTVVGVLLRAALPRPDDANDGGAQQ